MRSHPLLVLASTAPTWLLLACTSDLQAPDNYQESSATATDSSGGQVAIDCESIPDGALLAEFDYTPAASGGEGALSWSQTGLPAGLVLDASTGRISGVPEAEGPASVELMVEDAEGATGMATCEFEVNPALDIDLGLVLQAPPFCVRPGEDLLNFVIEGTGDGTPIVCDHPGGSGNGKQPAGISVNPDSCEFEGTLMENRYGTWVFMVRGTQSGREVFVPYCITNDEQAAGAYEITVDHSGLGDMGVDATLVPILRTFNPNADFAVGEPGDPLFTVTDPGSCGASCFYGFAFSINASPFDADTFSITGDMLLSDDNGAPIGLEHGLSVEGPSASAAPDFAETFGDRPFVLNVAMDYCIADSEGPCDGAQNIRDNGNGNLETAILMVPE